MVSEELTKFIQSNVPTIWALRVLVVMCQDQGRTWTPDELNRELRGTIGLVLDVLTRFERAKLVRREADDRYRWAPSTELESVAQELVSTYSTYPVAVVRVIMDTQTQRIQSLADAFRIKKD